MSPTSRSPPIPGSILLVGASVRAAAQSARRAGLRTLAADQFADVDLQTLGPCRQVADYPGGLIAAVRSFPPGSWMYTGALENYPRVIEAIGRDRPLAGNPAHVVRLVRDPDWLHDRFLERNIPCPDIRKYDDIPPPGNWVCKPRRSGGGRRIRRAGSPAMRRGPTPNDYWQEFIPGTPIGSVFLGDHGRARLLGVSRQLTGTDWTGAAPFMYAGSIGPIPLPPPVLDQVQRIGDVLALDGRLVGLFGIDAILREGVIWPLEVNPRYTASIEVLERAGNLLSIPLHLQACGFWPASVDRNGGPEGATRMCGKAIVYADSPVTVPAAFVDYAADVNGPSLWPSIADIPPAGTEISPGQPICTVLVEAASQNEGEVECQLRRQVVHIRQLLRTTRSRR